MAPMSQLKFDSGINLHLAIIMLTSRREWIAVPWTTAISRYKEPGGVRVRRSSRICNAQQSITWTTSIEPEHSNWDQLSDANIDNDTARRTWIICLVIIVRILIIVVRIRPMPNQKRVVRSATRERVVTRAIPSPQIPLKDNADILAVLVGRYIACIVCACCGVGCSSVETAHVFDIAAEIVVWAVEILHTVGGYTPLK